MTGKYVPPLKGRGAVGFWLTVNPGSTEMLTVDADGNVSSQAIPSGGGGVTDHGALTGLSDDDHPQYAPKANPVFTGTMDFPVGAFLTCGGQTFMYLDLLSRYYYCFTGSHVFRSSLGNVLKVDANGDTEIWGNCLARGNLLGGTITASGTFTQNAMVSTAALRTQFQIVPTWIDSADATRRAQVAIKVSDTVDRDAIRLFTDGTNGYAAVKTPTSAPADSELQNGEAVQYESGGNLWVKFKNGSGVVQSKQMIP